MFRQPCTLLALSLICLASTVAISQNAPTTGDRPKVGLVLEGGGALGLAHIGVIQYLEEHRIPVSYVAGTSMGGLVGGVYATGRNAAEVREMVKSIDWDQVISGQIPYDDLSFRRKADAHEYPSTLEFGLHKGLQFPAGFNSGQQVDLILDHIALPYSEIQSFNELPIPFACVATDLVTNSKHVFRSGPLDLALRSTMSLPGIFSPVRVEGHVYVDGGLMDNIPLDVAKEMGADFLLGIHLETAPLNPNEPMSSFAVLGQSISAMVAANENRSKPLADLLVIVPLQKYSAMDYNAFDAIIKAGYDAAAANGEQLSKLAVDEATWKQYLAERESRRRTAPTPTFVEVAGVPPDIARPMTDELSNFAGQPVNTAEINNEILEQDGTGPLSSVNYSMVKKNDQQGLQFLVDTKSYSPPVVRPLILINGADYNDVFFSIGARITFMNFGGYRRELRNDVIFGSQYGIQTEYYRPFTALSNWFVAPRVGFNSMQYPLYNGNDLVALYRNRVALGGLDLGYAFGKTGELRLGYEGGYQHLSPTIGADNVLPTVSGATGDVKIQYILNTRNEAVIPRKGEYIQFYTKYYNANPDAPEGFPLSEAVVQNFFQLNEQSTIFLHGYGGTSYGYKTGIPAFALGGVTRLAAYGTNELLTNQYFLFQAGYIRTLYKLPALFGSTI
ncbi:MAG TPA: patatin-like phospholipase family protein, partial [Candidatus Angelobacter sp.]|nr:patatin-like phospholipase family protein [Candidatus Angelobacter sp.]